jgi:hypothetical protein
MVSSICEIRKAALAAGWVVCLTLVLLGCEVAQERVYIYTQPIANESLFNSGPTQADLIEALQEFAKAHGFRCRQHVKRWDEWSCVGPHGMRITFEPDRGKHRFVAEFTLVIRSEEYASDYREFVDQFVDDMHIRFAGSVIDAAQRH